MHFLINKTSYTKKPTIAIIGTRGIPAGYGGCETIAQELGAGLVKKGYSVYVSCEAKGVFFKHYGIYKGIRLVYFPVIRSIRALSEVLLYDMLSIAWTTFRVDVLYMQGFSSILLLIFPRILGKEVMVNVDGFEAARPKFHPLLRFFYRSFESLTAKIAKHVVVDSKSVGRYYQQRYKINPIYIPNGGGCTRIIKPLGVETLDKFGVKKGEYYLYIARLTPDNSIDFIVDAFSKSSSQKKLLVIGPLENNIFIKRLTLNKDPRVIFAGGIYDPQLQRTLRYNCFAYVHGHRMGGTSVSLVEAMSCGNNILAYDNSSNREVVEGAAVYFKRDMEDLKRLFNNDLEHKTYEMMGNKAALMLYAKKYSANFTINEFIRAVNLISLGKISCQRDTARK